LIRRASEFRNQHSAPLKACSIFTLFFRCHLAALNRSGASVNRESNFLCFHFWIVIGRISDAAALKSMKAKKQLAAQARAISINANVTL